MKLELLIIVPFLVLTSCASTQSVMTGRNAGPANTPGDTLSADTEKCVHMTWTAPPKGSVVAYRENGMLFIKEEAAAPGRQSIESGPEQVSTDGSDLSSRDCDGRPFVGQPEKVVIDICRQPAMLSTIKIGVPGTPGVILPGLTR